MDIGHPGEDEESNSNSKGGEMHIKTVEDLTRLGDTLRSDLAGGRPRILVGTGTCGIASGAQKVMDALVEEAAARGQDVDVLETGCNGACFLEPVDLPSRI